MRLIFTIFIVALVSACTIQDACEIYNNSGDDLTIVRWRTGEQEQHIHVGEGESVLLRDWAFWSYRLVLKGRSMHYSPQNPGLDFVVTRGFGPWLTRVFNVQIESDGRIFVLMPTQIAPVKNFVKQPLGFPINPIDDSNPAAN